MKKRKLTPFGMLIRKRLLELGLSQAWLAKQVGTTKVYLNYILHGERSGKKYRSKILETLDIDPESLENVAS